MYYLYVMSMSGFIKIGYSANPLQRKEQIESNCPFTVCIEKTIKFKSKYTVIAIESNCHKILAALGFHVKGEWFSCNLSDALSCIVDAIANYNRNFKKKEKSKMLLNEIYVSNLIKARSVAAELLIEASKLDHHTLVSHLKSGLKSITQWVDAVMWHLNTLKTSIFFSEANTGDRYLKKLQNKLSKIKNIREGKSDAKPE